MTQTPTPPPGWYPQGGQERWWDGTGWTEHFQPLQSAQPAQPGQPTQPYGQAQYGQQQPYYAPYAPASAKKSHTARNLLIVFGVIFLLFVGGCVAVVAIVGHKVDQAVNDQTPCGPNVPKNITVGQAFTCKDFDYAAGWSVAADGVGDATINGLQVTNHRGKSDYLLIHIDLRRGSQVLATINCNLGSGLKIASGDTQTLQCTSTDTLPTNYDRVTLMDAV